MPFTFSHPAIVLPFKFISNKWFSLTGLIIGSLTPDFEYFIKMKVESNFSHSIPGIFYFDLPFAIMLTFIFHNIVRDKLFENSPKIIKTRTINFKNFNWNKYFKLNYLVVIISILIGISSHIFWDSFTHRTGYFVTKINYLQKIVEIQDLDIPIYKILQHVSTILGGLIIVFSFYRLPKNENSSDKMNYKYWLLLVTSITLVMAFRFLLGIDFQAYGNVIVSMISSILISLIIAPLILGIKQEPTTVNRQ